MNVDDARAHGDPQSKTCDESLLNLAITQQSTEDISELLPFR